MAPAVFQYQQLNLDDFKLLKPIRSGGRFISQLKYKEEKGYIYLQLPKMKAVSGIVKVDNKYYVDLEFSDRGFYDFITKLDELFVKTSSDNSKDWYGREIPVSTIEKRYESMIKRSENSDVRPTIRYRLEMSSDNKLNCEIFNQYRDTVDWEDVSSGTEMIAIVKMVGMWQTNHHMGCACTVVKMKAYCRVEELERGYTFIDISDDEYSSDDDDSSDDETKTRSKTLTIPPTPRFTEPLATSIPLSKSVPPTPAPPTTPASVTSVKSKKHSKHDSEDESSDDSDDDRRSKRHSSRDRDDTSERHSHKREDDHRKSERKPDLSKEDTDESSDDEGEVRKLKLKRAAGIDLSVLKSLKSSKSDGDRKKNSKSSDDEEEDVKLEDKDIE
jgi:hypothetical protein